MTQPFTGEIQIFGFNFAPSQWALANGATIALQQNPTLYALLGTQYGGNGTSTFQLPNFVNRVAVSQGQGPGLTSRVMGETVGENQVSLNQSQIPQHNHALNVYPNPTTAPAPTTGAGVGAPRSARLYAPYTTPPTVTLAPTVMTQAGSSQPHENRQPFLALNFSIALYGSFPAFN